MTAPVGSLSPAQQRVLLACHRHGRLERRRNRWHAEVGSIRRRMADVRFANCTIQLLVGGALLTIDARHKRQRYARLTGRGHWFCATLASRS